MMIKFIEKNMKAGVLLLFVLLLCYAIYKSYGALLPTAELNYRLDVTFEFDGMPVTGSAVQKLNAVRVRGLTPRTFNLTATGEAVTVDLPNGKTVFVLLASPTKNGVFTGSTKGRYDFLLPEACGLWAERDELGPSGFVRFLQSFSGSCLIRPEDLPLMVTFLDETDPTTVKRVFPSDPRAALGASVRFKGASITITDEQMTQGIGQRLGWLSKFYEPRLENAPPSSEPSFSQIMQHGFFRRFEND